jgi:hypothetical protein
MYELELNHKIRKVWQKNGGGGGFASLSKGHGHSLYFETQNFFKIKHTEAEKAIIIISSILQIMGLTIP